MSENRSGYPWLPENREEAPTTQQFPPQAWEPAPPVVPPKRNRGLGVVVAVAAVAVVLAGVAVSWMVGLFGDSRGMTEAPTTLTITSTVEESPAQTSVRGAAPEPEERPTVNSVPSSAIPANAAAVNEEPTGDFGSVWRGTSITSEPFANAVRNAFVGQYRATGRTDVTLNVYSPVTGQSYDMTCRDNGSYVTCTGGNNAVVHIS